MPAVKAKNMVYLTGMKSNDETTIDQTGKPHSSSYRAGKKQKAFQEKYYARRMISNPSAILKDGSATKLYGDKGKNGVIVIKTKKAK